MRSSLWSARASIFFVFASFTAILGLSPISAASAYNAHPKLVVVIVIDQFRGDYLERYRDQFGDSGFRLLLDHGAYFPNCNYNYANTRTAPGHSTLFTGAYSNGHGIADNEWWDPKKKRMVTSVEDDDTKLLGVSGSKTGSSPHNLLADTIGDELKLATQGKARVFGVSLKDRAAVLPAGFAGDAAYWIDEQTRCLGYLHLLPRQSAQVGAGFQHDSSSEILGSRMERRSGRSSPIHGASQERRRL